jgi:phage N-6-adenine-methyltransferase
MSTTGAGFNRGQSKQDYATPPNFMSAVANRFGRISFDLAASADNTKSKNYFSKEQNSLVQDWHKIHRSWLFLNPPFDNIAPWAEKCAAESSLGAHILFLVPASIGSNWFAQHVFKKSLVLALNGRICFDGIAPYPKDLLLAVYGDTQGFDVWRWTDDVLI